MLGDHVIKCSLFQTNHAVQYALTINVKQSVGHVIVDAIEEHAAGQKKNVKV